MTLPYARVIADSVPARSIIDDDTTRSHERLTTFEVGFHRWILAEVNTHRMLSRNYRSSRAVPVTKLLHEVRTTPAMPITWMKNKPGMEATEMMTLAEQAVAEELWMQGAKEAATTAEMLAASGLHKQWANRVLEPYMFTYGVITGSDPYWDNFFDLRMAPDAQPEFQALARAMWDARQASMPISLKPGEWHLPYISAQERYHQTTIKNEPLSLVRWSTARMARVSIKPHDSDSIDTDKDEALFHRLLVQKHMSPFEHTATPHVEGGINNRNGNFSSAWVQYRKLIPGENGVHQLGVKW